MKIRPGPVLWAAALVVLSVLVLFAGQEPGAVASSLSRGPGGWLALRALLETNGVEVELIDAPLADARDEIDHSAPGVLVIAFPWQRGIDAGDRQTLVRHLRAGGTVLVGYSGRILQPREEEMIESLGMDNAEPRWPTIVPWRWRADRAEDWRLRPEPVLDGVRAPVVRAPRVVPEAPAGATVLYRGGPGNVPLVFAYPSGRGRVLVLPADLWSNARLDEPGNADLAATVMRWLDGPWRLDEYHHGLVDPAVARARLATFVVIELGFLRLTFWDLLVFHLALLYLLALIAHGRRFGPPWREPPSAGGGVAVFLRGTGLLHHRLGHHRDAARAMVRRARELHPALELADLELAASAVADGSGLVALGRRLAARQRGARVG